MIRAFGAPRRAPPRPKRIHAPLSGSRRSSTRGRRHRATPARGARAPRQRGSPSGTRPAGQVSPGSNRGNRCRAGQRTERSRPPGDRRACHRHRSRRSQRRRTTGDWSTDNRREGAAPCAPRASTMEETVASRGKDAASIEHFAIGSPWSVAMRTSALLVLRTMPRPSSTSMPQRLRAISVIQRHAARGPSMPNRSESVLAGSVSSHSIKTVGTIMSVTAPAAPRRPRPRVPSARRRRARGRARGWPASSPPPTRGSVSGLRGAGPRRRSPPR